MATKRKQKKTNVYLLPPFADKTMEWWSGVVAAAERREHDARSIKQDASGKAK